MKPSRENYLQIFVGLVCGIALILIGLHSFINRTWHFRSGSLSTSEQAEYLGMFILIIGVILIVIQIYDWLKNK